MSTVASSLPVPFDSDPVGRALHRLPAVPAVECPEGPTSWTPRTLDGSRLPSGRGGGRPTLVAARLAWRERFVLEIVIGENEPS